MVIYIHVVALVLQIVETILNNVICTFSTLFFVESSKKFLYQMKRTSRIHSPSSRIQPAYGVRLRLGSCYTLLRMTTKSVDKTLQRQTMPQKFASNENKYFFPLPSNSRRQLIKSKSKLRARTTLRFTPLFKTPLLIPQTEIQEKCKQRSSPPPPLCPKGEKNKPHITQKANTDTPTPCTAATQAYKATKKKKKMCSVKSPR